MKPRKCPVHECGAVILELKVDGVPMAVNPEPFSVVTGSGKENWQVVTGYQPHWLTCVDITGRLAAKA